MGVYAPVLIFILSRKLFLFFLFPVLEVLLIKALESLVKNSCSNFRFVFGGELWGLALRMQLTYT